LEDGTPVRHERAHHEELARLVDGFAHLAAVDIQYAYMESKTEKREWRVEIK
jgi:hypothetical protein